MGAQCWTSSSCDSGREMACSFTASNAMDSRSESLIVRLLQQRRRDTAFDRSLDVKTHLLDQF